AFGDLSEQRADRDRLAVLGGDLAERAGGRRRDLDRDLVGLELDQRFIDRHGIAGLLEPAADGGLGHGLAERRNTNFSHWSVSSIAFNIRRRPPCALLRTGADDPVFRDGPDQYRAARRTGCPAFAGRDGLKILSSARHPAGP